MASNDGDATRPGGFDLAELASQARPREVTSVTFSYVDAMLTGRMSEADLARIRQDLLGEAATLDPASPAPPTSPGRTTIVDPAMARIEALMAARDHFGALRDADAILARDPTHAAAARAAEQCRRHLGDVYLSHLGTGFDIPRLAVPVETLGAHGVDRWSAYLISRFDDHVTVDDLIHLTGYSRLDTYRLLYDLVQRGIAALERMTPPPSGPPSAPRTSAGAGATATSSVAVARVKLKTIPS